jgi:hypothetical protein
MGAKPMQACVPTQGGLSSAAARPIRFYRDLFDVIDAPSGWSDDMGYGAQHAARPPFFVVTHELPTDVRLGLDFRFVPDVPTAIEEAKAVAGDKDVFVMGGGEIIRQSVRRGPRALRGSGLHGGERTRNGATERERPPDAHMHVSLDPSEPAGSRVEYECQLNPDRFLFGKLEGPSSATGERAGVSVDCDASVVCRG